MNGHHAAPSGARHTEPGLQVNWRLDCGSSVNYSSQMIDVQKTDAFAQWLGSLRDDRAAERIAMRIVRLQSGLMGDVKFFDGIGEMRIDYGPGYRLYFVQRGKTLVVLLCGGDKSSQGRDVKRAKMLAKEV
jgi:putative addiction module killer protein